MKTFVLIVAFHLAGSFLLQAEVKVSGLFGDNMVLQRDEPVKVWGWADQGELVKVKLAGQQYKTKATRQGEWEITMKPMPFGGPYTLVVEGKNNTIQYSDILIGDIWLCSGQSNMEWPVSMAANAEQEIDSANYPLIRSLNVPKKIHVLPQRDLSAKWEVCTPAVAGEFSAVAYYYARELYCKLGIPIGIINSSWGGTDIEAWTTPDSYEALPADLRRANDPGLMESIHTYLKKNAGKLDGYSDAVLNDKGLADKWYDETTDITPWNEMQVPEAWSGSLAGIDGLVWFRYEFVLPVQAAGKQATLHLGQIDDNDIAWVNSREVGRTNGYNQSRMYDVPAGVLKAGRNIVAVRVTDNLGPGGFISQPGDLFLEINPAGLKVPLAGSWKYEPSVVNADFYKATLGPNSIYASLYNGMIHPLARFRIKGAIWYQGESNAGQALAYQTLFPNLIGSWRQKWGYDFSFYWVQLANFMAKDEQPADSDWAKLREAQTLTLTTLKTGQAVIIDIGEAADIHPRNKQEVGRRLALIALYKNYGVDNLVYSGPTLASMERVGDKALLTFDTHGSELMVLNKYGYVEGFSVAGADKKFVWAKAWIQDGKVVVWSDQIREPVAVRFGWGNNPDINLFNKEGLPAVPFRTDKW